MGKFTSFADTGEKTYIFVDTDEKIYKNCGHGFNGKNTLICARNLYVCD